MSFEEETKRVVSWHDREWPSPDGSRATIERVSMKLTEEVGELQGAIVKHLQGRTDKDWVAEACKEFGDVVIVLAVLADRIQEMSADQDVSFLNMFVNRWLGDGDDPGVSSRRGASYRGDSGL